MDESTASSSSKVDTTINYSWILPSTFTSLVQYQNTNTCRISIPPEVFSAALTNTGLDAFEITVIYFLIHSIGPSFKRYKDYYENYQNIC